MQTIGILGAGAWGTALATVAARAGRQVILQAHEPTVAESLARDRENAAFLPGVRLDPSIVITSEPAEAIVAAAVLVAVPAQFLRQVLRRVAATWPAGTPAVICAKGIEHGTCALMSEVLEATLPQAPIAVLSGPSFAIEVARERPTAMTLASADPDLREALPVRLGTRSFRIYSSDDVVGVELGGSLKNVVAIAAGVVEGRELGDNARAALITRGLAEMARLGVAMGAKAETLMGLSGLGDLVLTCSAMQSRNFSLGVALGRGEALASVLAERTSVAEGVFSAAAVTELARRHGVSMPIASAVDAVVNSGASVDATIEGLLARPLRAEGWTN
jgi:Glycerol-3-phosphate dehydrogenase